MAVISGLTRTRILNFALFQAGWFCCVLGAAAGRPWLGTGLGLCLVLAHLALAGERRAEAELLLGALALGLVVDTAHLRLGTLVFQGGHLHPDFAPPWLLVLWLQFVSTLRFSMHWLAGRYVLGGLLGGVAGALAYWAGVRLGAASFGVEPAFALLRIGLSWGLALPLLLLMEGMGKGREGSRSYRIF
jgi:hypothetical protein